MNLTKRKTLLFTLVSLLLVACTILLATMGTATASIASAATAPEGYYRPLGPGVKREDSVVNRWIRVYKDDFGRYEVIGENGSILVRYSNVNFFDTKGDDVDYEFLFYEGKDSFGLFKDYYMDEEIMLLHLGENQESWSAHPDNAYFLEEYYRVLGDEVTREDSVLNKWIRIYEKDEGFYEIYGEIGMIYVDYTESYVTDGSLNHVDEDIFFYEGEDTFGEFKDYYMDEEIMITYLGEDQDYWGVHVGGVYFLEDDFEAPDKPVEQPNDKPSDKPSDEPVDKPSDEPVDEPSDEPVDEPSDEPVDEPSDEPVDEPTNEPAVGTTDEKPEELDLQKIAMVGGSVILLVVVLGCVVSLFRKRK